MASSVDYQARSYIADTGKISLTVAGNLRVLFSNPSNSGRTAYVQRIAGLATSIAWAPLYINPTVGLPAASAGIAALRLTGPASVCTLLADQSATTALSGGTASGLVIGVPAGGRFSVDLFAPLEVPPGYSAGVNVPFTGSADVAFALHYFEE